MMFKLFVFTIFLVTSSTFGLLETLYQTENDCYSGCDSNYIDNLLNLDACKKGCDYKLQTENCVDQCKLLSIHEQIQASCLIGCSMNHPKTKQSIETHGPQSIILIRLRQRPLIRFPSSNSDSVEIFDKTNKVKHFIIHQEDEHNHFQEFIKNIHNKWNQLISKQSKLPIWILLSIFILSSVLLSYMIVLICWKKPKYHNLSIRSEELILEKEIIQPDSPIKMKLTPI